MNFMSQRPQKNPVKPYKGEGYEGVVARLEARYEEVFGDDFYREIFPDNECSGEQSVNQHYQKPNAVYLYEDKDEGRMRRRIMLADTWDDDFCEYVERSSLALCSGLAYRGSTNRYENAQQMNALIFDLDEVGVSEFMNLMLRMDLPPNHLRSLPTPTFLVASGAGLHLYYVLKQPVSLYPNIKTQLKALKNDLTFRLWDYKGTTQNENIQYQGIHQAYRMVGSVNSKYNTVIRAFRTGPKTTLERLNVYCDDPAHQVDLTKRYLPTKMSLEDAKKQYPDWYQRRIVQGRPRGCWRCKTDLYNWWVRQLPQVRGGHRYYFLMVLAIYASKCGVSKEQLRDDMYALFGRLQKIKHNNPFTSKDVESALRVYDKDYQRFTIDDIEKLSGIRIEKNKRNGRKQPEHLKLARFVRDEINGKKDTWRDGNGRPKGSGTKQQIVHEWRTAHPGGRKADCVRDTGLSKPTVYKWWDWDPKKELP